MQNVDGGAACPSFTTIKQKLPVMDCSGNYAFFCPTRPASLSELSSLDEASNTVQPMAAVHILTPRGAMGWVVSALSLAVPGNNFFHV